MLKPPSLPLLFTPPKRGTGVRMDMGQKRILSALVKEPFSVEARWKDEGKGNLEAVTPQKQLRRKKESTITHVIVGE